MVVTAELRAWVQENLARGCSAPDMISAMTRAGHDEGFSRETVSLAIKALAAAQAAARPDGPVKLPEPLRERLSDGSSYISTADRMVGVIATFAKPRIVVLQGVLTNEECDALIAESRPKLERSRTVNRDDGGTELNASRTSEGTYFFHNESPLLERINSRLAEITDWPLENGEPLQILHYGVGAQYEPHYDFFDPEDAGTPTLVAAGGQRVATLIVYLNRPEGGGATTFPDIGLEVAAVKGNAVFFSYEVAGPSSLTLHGGAPVTRGEKWIATRWMRERPYR